MDNQLGFCDTCHHYMFNECMRKYRFNEECYYEPAENCNGCVDHKKKTYKGTKCLQGCRRYCCSIRAGWKLEGRPDYYRKEENNDRKRVSTVSSKDNE